MNHKKIGNFIKAVTTHAMDGFLNVDKETEQARLSICKKCEHYINPDNPVCNICKCYLNVKTRWASESCPIKKWLAKSQDRNGNFSNVIEEPIERKTQYHCDTCSGKE